MTLVIFARDDADYEQVRQESLWNQRTPERFPDLIAQVETAEDVTAALRLAADRELRVTVRSGGHSWTGNHLRDGGMVIDVSRLDGLEVDAEALTAAVGPGLRGISAGLEPYDLFFPGGHSDAVAVGGYLLQGGFGWNGRVHGPACMNVYAVDVVTADGELIHADEHNHADLLWAARGSGPGFFGVVVGFHLRVYPRPRHVAMTMVRFPFELVEEVFAWGHATGPLIADEVELNLVVHLDEAGDPVITMFVPALVGSAEEAAEALAFVDKCPLRDRALEYVPNTEVTLADLYATVDTFYPAEHRYAADNMWTHATASELVPGVRALAATLPPPPSAMLWFYWGELTPPRPEMAYSVEDEIYVALYGVWRDPADDGRYARWPEDNMRAMEDLSSGIQLADENLGRRPARFISDENLARLDRVREHYDPDSRFHPWAGRLRTSGQVTTA